VSASPAHVNADRGSRALSTHGLTLASPRRPDYRLYRFRALSYDGKEIGHSFPDRRIDPPMCALRLVADDRAGPSAVGILAPPARRTFVIVRPRSLPFDLLVLADARGTAFRGFDREQAGRAAEALFDALAARAEASPGRVQTTTTCDPTDGDGYQVRVHAGPFHLLVCAREPGQPYTPLSFPDAAAARTAADGIAALLCPPAGVDQEFYLNTRHFQR
jgi:hypothetical protein